MNKNNILKIILLGLILIESGCINSNTSTNVVEFNHITIDQIIKLEDNYSLLIRDIQPTTIGGRTNEVYLTLIDGNKPIAMEILIENLSTDFGLLTGEIKIETAFTGTKTKKPYTNIKYTTFQEKYTWKSKQKNK